MTPLQDFFAFIKDVFGIDAELDVRSGTTNRNKMDYQRIESYHYRAEDPYPLTFFIDNAATAQLYVSFSLMNQQYVCTLNFVRTMCDEGYELMKCVDWTLEFSDELTLEYIVEKLLVDPKAEEDCCVYRLVGEDGEGIYNGNGRDWAVKFLEISAPEKKLIDHSKEGFKFAFNSFDDLWYAIHLAPVEMFTKGKVRIEIIPASIVVPSHGQCVFLPDESAFKTICLAA